MLRKFISLKCNEWFQSPQCSIKSMIDYMQNLGKLRDAQIEAIKTYLFLKIFHNAKPLYELVTEGAFLSLNISEEELSDKVKNALRADPALAMLYELASFKDADGNFLSEKTIERIRTTPEQVKAKEFWKEYFYNTSYTDYLFSLPMGSGKTFLMAAFIYLDLYFAINEPDNPAFAHNFIILAPSGLKSSVIPSLKTIERFDPSWVLPEPTASNIKREIKFELLDQQKTAKRSNKTKNPNVQKLALHQPFENLFGLVAVTNAEKVILDRINETKGQFNFFEDSDDDRDRQANELRNLIGKIPSLAIFIDEVHHAATDDKKLRAVVNKWASREKVDAGHSSVNAVISFSGTPYLEKAEKFSVTSNLKITMKEITNVVYYYPLLEGIGNFLKEPKVRVSDDRNRINIVETGLRDFLGQYKDTVYSDGTIAKVAIYSGLIASLEEEIYPLVERVSREYGLDPTTSILKFYREGGGKGKKYQLPPQNEIDFLSLDQPHSKHQIILLAQIGKEGWDCRSLTGVILSQEGDCPTNMVLQTSCRCLRQTERNAKETALIVLNKGNADTLKQQLHEQQKITLLEFQQGKESNLMTLHRYDRTQKLKLPKLHFYQMAVQYLAQEVQQAPDPKLILPSLAQSNKKEAVLMWSEAFDGKVSDREIDATERGTRPASYIGFQNDIIRGSFGNLTYEDLKPHDAELQALYTVITKENESGTIIYSSNYDYEKLLMEIRLSFFTKRVLQVQEEFVKGEAALLDISRFQSEIQTSDLKPYVPNAVKVERIIDDDKNELKIPPHINQVVNVLRGTSDEHMIAEILEPYKPYDEADRTYHYLPYKTDSAFERQFLAEVLENQVIRDLDLEVYFNGDEQFTEFRLKCYEKARNGWKYLGRYTPDFLVLQRKNEEIYKAMIIETKGEIYANDPVFKAKRLFIETVFCPENNRQFDYSRFRYLYLPSSLEESTRIVKTIEAIESFFEENTPCQ